MKRLLRLPYRHRHKPEHDFPRCRFADADETVYSVPVAGGSTTLPSWEEHFESTAPLKLFGELIRTLTSEQHSVAEDTGPEVASPLVGRLDSQPLIFPQASPPETREDTLPVLELHHPHELGEPDISPAPPLVSVSEPKSPGVETISNPILNPRHEQRCEACEVDHPVVWFCRACNLTYCDQCWSGQLVHRKNLAQPGDVAHEKTNLEIAERVRNALTPPTDEGMREKLHHGDDITAWFGIERRGKGKTSRLVLYDYGRLLDIRRARISDTAQPVQTPMVPSLASFVGETGAGAKFKFERRRDEETKARLDENYFKSQRILSEYELQWSIGEGSKTRGFAVTHLYPRLIYAFSDVIVFVLHNARVIEQVFEKLVTWAVNAIEASANQPLLPHAIIVLNKHEDFTMLGGSPAETSDILQDISHVIDLNETFSKWADYWRTRGKPISTLSDLIHCYYSSIKILRVPGRDRPQLVHDRVKQLQMSISESCIAAQTSRSRAGMLLDIQDLQTYMQEAFTTFSAKIDSSFDFTRVSLRMSHLSADFGGNLLKLLRGVVNFIIASYIMLDAARHSDKGRPSDIFPRYIDQIEDVLESFCDRLWPCEVRDPKTRARCVNTSFGHAKGHQSRNGKVFAAGGYESSFSFQQYRQTFLCSIYHSLQTIGAEVSEKVNSLCISELQAAAEVHQSIARSFFRVADPTEKRSEGVGPLTSHSACFCCFFEPGEHPMLCGHVLCTPCVTSYGKRGVSTEVEVEMNGCPIGCPWPRRSKSQIVRFKPKSAGVRVLSLDGGGVRGIVELEILKQIELTLGGRLPIQAFLDLIVGTSTGGLVALGLGAMGWSVDTCIDRFEDLCTKAFTRRKGGFIVENFHHSNYQTTSLEEALQTAFSEDMLLFGGEHRAESSILSVKVAVTSFSLTDNKAFVLSNYNRPWGSRNSMDYHFQRPETISEELKIWEAARATSAAPQYFKKFFHGESQKTYLDGAMLHNNPIAIAEEERTALWPEVHYPDVMLSLGTGRSGSDEVSMRSLSRAKTGIITYWQHLIELLRMNMDTTLDCDKAWVKYETLVKLVVGCLAPPKPMFRISPNIQTRLPALDDTSKIKELRRQARESLAGSPDLLELYPTLSHLRFISSLSRSRTGTQKGFGSQNTGRICCRLPQRSNELAGFGDHLKKQARIQGPLRVHISNEDNEGKKVHIATAELSAMVDAMARNQPSSEPLSFELKNKAALIEMRLQFGDKASSSFFISGFPRSLSSESPIRGRPRSPQAVAGSPAGSPRHDRVVDWKPPEQQDETYTVGIRGYTDPSRKLGYHISEPKRSTPREVDEARLREEKLRQAVAVLLEKTKRQHEEAMNNLKEEAAY
ncbi:FabD/lysophospholipase-like protein [Madurella fahalii]|uniref:FabD/lysophospholipase-like protein n=1 Tax=Madurella fahalii TaxID=1157608 RepID=A0ABQ0GKA1_9PEZI